MLSAWHEGCFEPPTVGFLSRKFILRMFPSLPLPLLETMAVKKHNNNLHVVSQTDVLCVWMHKDHSGKFRFIKHPKLTVGIDIYYITE